MKSEVIFLLGFMGAGKSTIGKKVSNKLNYTFIDLDHYITNDLCSSISEIVSKKGISYFRKQEQRCLNEVLLLEGNRVVSLGGGTVCSKGVMSLLNKIGTTVYINLPNKMLASRLWNNKGNRPLIASIKSQKEMGEFVDNLLSERAKYYLQSQIVIDGTVSVQQLVDYILVK